MRYRIFIGILAFLASCPSPASAAISKIGGCKAATTSCTMPGNNIGDYIYVFAFRSATTAPSLPAGFTSIATASANSSSFRSGCKVATTTTEVSGTWTNATSITVEIYRGTRAPTTALCATVNVGIGGNANSSGTTSTITFATITMSYANSTSWVIGASGNSVGTCTPAGMTAQQSQTTVNILNDTNAPVNSWSSTNCTGSAGNWKSNVVELVASPCFNTSFGNGRTCVQETLPTQGAGGSASAVTATFFANASTSDLISVMLFYCPTAGCSGTTTATPTLTGTAITAASCVLDGAGQTIEASHYYYSYVCPAAAGTTVIVTPSASVSFLQSYVSEWTGGPTSSYFNGNGAGATGTGTTASVSTTASTTDVVICASDWANGISTLAVSAGMAQVDINNAIGNPALEANTAFSGSITPGWTWTTSVVWTEFCSKMIKASTTAATMVPVVY